MDVSALALLLSAGPYFLQAETTPLCPLCAWPYRQLPQMETENSTTNPDKLIIHKSITFLKAEMFSVNSHSAKL